MKNDDKHKLFSNDNIDNSEETTNNEEEDETYVEE